MNFKKKLCAALTAAVGFANFLIPSVNAYTVVHYNETETLVSKAAEADPQPETGNAETETIAAVTNDKETGSLFGDVNSDGAIDSKDASIILICCASVILGNEPTLSNETADVNSDGVTDPKDATTILIYYARSILDKNIGSLKDSLKQ